MDAGQRRKKNSTGSQRLKRTVDRALDEEASNANTKRARVRVAARDTVIPDTTTDEYDSGSDKLGE